MQIAGNTVTIRYVRQIYICPGVFCISVFARYGGWRCFLTAACRIKIEKFYMILSSRISINTSELRNTIIKNRTYNV